LAVIVPGSSLNLSVTTHFGVTLKFNSSALSSFFTVALQFKASARPLIEVASAVNVSFSSSAHASILMFTFSQSSSPVGVVFSNVINVSHNLQYHSVHSCNENQLHDQSIEFGSIILYVIVAVLPSFVNVTSHVHSSALVLSVLTVNVVPEILISPQLSRIAFVIHSSHNLHVLSLHIVISHKLLPHSHKSIHDSNHTSRNPSANTQEIGL
jgi:hypothetical protein